MIHFGVFTFCVFYLSLIPKAWKTQSIYSRLDLWFRKKKHVFLFNRTTSLKRSFINFVGQISKKINLSKFKKFQNISFWKRNIFFLFLQNIENSQVLFSCYLASDLDEGEISNLWFCHFWLSVSCGIAASSSIEIWLQRTKYKWINFEQVGNFKF